MSFTLSSRAFEPGDDVPVRFTCDGANLSPPLAWRDPPTGTKAFALVVDDPNAPQGTFTHWLLWNIPVSPGHLEEGLRPGQAGVSGTNDFSRPGYGGPCPPRKHGPHHYRFHLHALSGPLDLTAGASRGDVDGALAGRILGTAMLEGIYERT